MFCSTSKVIDELLGLGFHAVPTRQEGLMVFVRGIDQSHLLVIPTNLDLIPSAVVRHILRNVLSETPFGVENFLAKVRVN